MLERVSFWCDEIRRTRRGYVLDWWGRPVACCILRSIVGGGLVAVLVVREGRRVLLTSVGARGRRQISHIIIALLLLLSLAIGDRTRSHESPHWLQSLTRGGGGGAAAYPYLGLLHVLLWWWQSLQHHLLPLSLCLDYIQSQNISPSSICWKTVFRETSRLFDSYIPDKGRRGKINWQQNWNMIIWIYFF